MLGDDLEAGVVEPFLARPGCLSAFSASAFRRAIFSAQPCRSAPSCRTRRSFRNPQPRFRDGRQLRRIGERFRAADAQPAQPPGLILIDAEGVVANPTEASPTTSAMTEGPPPLYGMCSILFRSGS